MALLQQPPLEVAPVEGRHPLQSRFLPCCYGASLPLCRDATAGPVSLLRRVLRVLVLALLLERNSSWLKYTQSFSLYPLRSLSSANIYSYRLAGVSLSLKTVALL